MKLIIAGSRSVTKTEFDKAIKKSKLLQYASVVICGKAKGVDTYGELWAKLNKIPIRYYPADWDNVDTNSVVIGINKNGKKYNKLAGFNRNEAMAQAADALVLIWKNDSKGSADMLERVKKYNLKIEVIKI